MDAPASLNGRTALIVGGTGGIGRRVAHALAGRGADLVVHGGHDRSRGESLQAELSGTGVRIRLVMGDIEKLEDADVLKEEALKADILVCAFGPFLRSPLDRMSRDQWRRMCELNLALPGYLVTAVLPGMVRRGYGRIVLFGGTGTDLPRGYRTVAAYSAAKLGLTVIARSVAESYAGANVTCNVVVPGFVDTEYLTEAERRTYAGLSRGEKLVDPGAVARWVAEIVVSDDGVPNGAILELSS